MIDTEALRKKVIDLAIQGKFTQQLPEDGNALNLYAQVQEEKAELVKEGKIKKEKLLPDISDDEIPFEIPNNWKWVRLGSVCNEMLVPQRDKPKQFDGDIPWCRIEDIEGKYLNGTKSNQFVSRETIESMSLRVNPVGTVISACSASIGAAAICTVECITNQTFIGLVCSKGLYNEYLYYFLKASIKSLKHLGTGMTISYISQDKYRDLLLPLPPLTEQKRIVTRIEEICVQIDIIDALQQQYESDREILKGKIIDAGIRGRLTEQLPEDGNAEDLYVQIQKEKAKLIKEGKIKKEKLLPEISDEEIPFELPRSWKWVRLGECVELLSGQDFVPENYNAIHDGLPYMTGASNIVNDELVVNRWTPYPKNISKYGDLLIVCKGSGFGKTVINHIGDVHIARQFMAIKDISKTIDLSYVRLVLDGNFELIKSNGQGLIPGIDRPTIRNMLLPLPPLNEQKRIVDEVNEMLCLIE